MKKLTNRINYIFEKNKKRVLQSCSCSGCTGCTSACSGNSTGGSCDGCTGGCGSCSDSCKGDCNGCGGACSTNCNSGCTRNCADNCSGSCDSGCYTGCYTGCKTGCKTTCKDGCNNSCKGTCTDLCNNACTSSSNLSSINNLGSGLKRDEYIRSSDVLSLKSAIDSEVSRRGTGSYYSYYSSLSYGYTIYTEHINKIMQEINSVSSFGYSNVNSSNIAYASKFDSLISKIKQLQLQNIHANDQPTNV